MAYKFCQNHLTELYEAIKQGNVAEIEKVEHELSSEEECVACAYALKAKGEAKRELLRFLKSEGFSVEVPREKGQTRSLVFWLLRIGVLALVFLAFWFPLKNFLNTPIILIIAFLFSVLVFIGLEQFLD
ncbi:hypothetical protein A2Z23_01775 [Candidatus Curtissbacteria bacterium RBG_16_39_7]|uniref:Uncharacterized protein n=1 Tax=Candidatus Curtissbacteria bacterium RBG_16_39_7 TaxID=1797707 RepID=A0A1F5G272_9BACT|nr:MAG: hypothetical protein A2Z23_01775 [Candidatus Curtissbacteria bacterium RBG_16_39_7]